MTDRLLLVFEDEDEEFERRVLHGIAHLIQLARSTNQQENQIMATQDDINAAVAALQDDESGLDASVTRIEALLQAPTVDTSALNAEVANLRSHVDSVAALAPVPDGGTPA